MQSFRGFNVETSVKYAAHASQVLGKDHWAVCDGFYYYLRYKDSVAWVYVPRGYLTDGASVPRIFWNLIPPWGKYGQAAIVHDYLCEFLSITVNGLPVRITREQADDILCEAMGVLEVPWWPREPMHMAVASYRVLARISEPTSIPLRRQLEAEWLAENPA